MAHQIFQMHLKHKLTGILNSSLQRLESEVNKDQFTKDQFACERFVTTVCKRDFLSFRVVDKRNLHHLP